MDTVLTAHATENLVHERLTVVLSFPTSQPYPPVWADISWERHDRLITALLGDETVSRWVGKGRVEDS